MCHTAPAGKVHSHPFLATQPLREALLQCGWCATSLRPQAPSYHHLSLALHPNLSGCSLQRRSSTGLCVPCSGFLETSFTVFVAFQTRSALCGGLRSRSIGGSGTYSSSSPAVRFLSSSGRPLPPARPVPLKYLNNRCHTRRVALCALQQKHLQSSSMLEGHRESVEGRRHWASWPSHSSEAAAKLLKPSTSACRPL